MAKKKKVILESKIEASVKETLKVPCSDCTILVADGGKSEFFGKGGPKAGLINENTHCSNCNGSGVV